MPVCPICSSANPLAQRPLQDYKVFRCPKCTVEFLHPQPNAEVLSGIYSANYFLGEREGVSGIEVSRQKRKTAEMYIGKLLSVTGGKKGSLLEVGCGSGDFLLAAQAKGFAVNGVEISGHAAASANERLGSAVVECSDIEAATLAPSAFDVAAFSDAIEHVRNPHDFLQRIHQSLRPGGIVFAVTPDTGSWSHRLMRNHWMEYKTEHLYYFNRRSLTVLLSEHGFDQIDFFPNVKALSFDYIRAHFRHFRVPVWSSMLEIMGKAIPKTLSRRIFPIVASGLGVTARKNPLRDPQAS